MEKITHDPSMKLKKSVYALALMPDNKPLKLTEIERKLFNVMLKVSMDSTTLRVRREDGMDWFKSTLSDFAKYLLKGRQELGTVFYINACRNLMSVVLEFTSPSSSDMDVLGDVESVDSKSKKTVWKGRHLVEKVDVINEDGHNIIYWRFDPEMEPLLLNPARFALLKLESIAKLTSVAAIVLYENCARFKETGSTGWKEWKYWVTLLTGIPTKGAGRAKTYDEFRYFNRMLKSVMAEINKMTEIDVVMDSPKKNGREVAEIRFLVSKKADVPGQFRSQRSPTIEKSHQEVSLIAKGLNVNISEEQIAKLLKKYSIQAIDQAMDSLVAAIASRDSDAELSPIRSNHAYVKGVLDRMHGVQKTPSASLPIGDTLRRDTLPQFSHTPVASRSSYNDIPTVISFKDERRSEIRSELFTLSRDDQQPYVYLALDELKQKRMDNATLREKVESGNWQTAPMLVSKMVELYAAEKYGPNWGVEQTSPEAS